MSSVVGSIAGTTGLGTERQIIYAINSGRWWAFQFTGTLTVSSWYSSDGINWTSGTSLTLAAVHNSEGRNLMVAYSIVGNLDTVWLCYIQTPTITHTVKARRATISGTTITYHTTDTTISDGTATGSLAVPAYSGGGWDFDSLNKIHCINGSLDVNQNVAATKSSADPGIAEQATPPTWSTVVDLQVMALTTKSGFVADTDGGTVLYLGDDATDDVTCTGLVSHKYDSSTWSSITSPVSGITAINKNDWGAVKRTASDVHMVYRDSTGNLNHFRWNGTAWGAGQIIPAQNSLSGGGVTLFSDGASVWLAVVDTDAANTIRYIKWTSNDYTGRGDAWNSVWSVAEGSSATRTFLGSCKTTDGSGNALLYWTEGSNYVAALVDAPPPPDPPGLANRDVISPLAAVTNSTTLQIIFTGIQPPLGDKISVGFWSFFASATTITSVVDNATSPSQNTYTAGPNRVGGTQGVWHYWLDLPQNAVWSGNYTITVTFSNTQTEADGGAVAYSNMQSGAPTNTNTNTSTSTTATPGAVNPALTPATYFVVLTDASGSNPATFTWPAPFLKEITQSNGSGQQAGSIGDALNNSGSQNPSITIDSSLWHAVQVVWPGAPIPTYLQNIKPGRNWQRRHWRGIKHPAPATIGVVGPISNTVTATDSLSALSDTATRIVSLSRSFSDSFAAMSDTVVRVVFFLRSSLDDISGMPLDLATRSLGLLRSALDTLAGLSDTATKGLSSFLRSGQDSLPAPSDIPTRIASHPRLAIDSLQVLSDSANMIKIIIRNVTDNLPAMSDTASRSILSFNRIASDTLANISDTATRLTQLARTSLDSLSALTDFASMIKVIIRSASDVLVATSDSATRTLFLIRHPSDSLAVLSDFATRAVQNFARSAADFLVSLSDNATRFLSLPRNAIDGLSNLTEFAIRSISIRRQATDALQSLSDQAIRFPLGLVRSALDNIPSISDVATNAGVIIQVFLHIASYVRDGSIFARARDGSLWATMRDGSLFDKVRDGSLRSNVRDASQRNKTRG